MKLGYIASDVVAGLALLPGPDIQVPQPLLGFWIYEHAFALQHEEARRRGGKIIPHNWMYQMLDGIPVVATSKNCAVCCGDQNATSMATLPVPPASLYGDAGIQNVRVNGQLILPALKRLGGLASYGDPLDSTKNPRWSREGNILYFFSGSRRLVNGVLCVDVVPGAPGNWCDMDAEIPIEAGLVPNLVESILARARVYMQNQDLAVTGEPNPEEQ